MRAFRAQTRIELLLTLRRGESLLVALVIPAGILVFFSFVPLHEGGGADFLLPGVICLAVIATAMVSAGIATGYERHYGVLKRLGSTPLGRPALLAAKSSAALAVEVLQLVLLAGIAYSLGWSLRGNPAAAAAVLLAGTAAFGGIGLALAGALRAETNLAVANALFLLLLLLSGAAVPLSALPDGLSSLARLLPAAALTESLRWGLDGGAAPVATLATLGVWAAAGPLLAAIAFRWDGD